MKNNKKWFTLIEILLWIVIFAISIMWWFKALSSVWIAKVKLVEETKILKDSIYFTEKLFDMIKKWWTIDYEEYYNRKIVNLWGWVIYQSGHFIKNTWYGNYWFWWDIAAGNYWSWFYYCRSSLDTKMWSWGCFSWATFNTYWADIRWKFQRYWEYSLQFVDYNASNLDDAPWKAWDEDGDWFIRWDNDDEYLGIGPKAFERWINTTELYLLSWDWKTRTFFRRTVRDDIADNCNYWDWSSPTWSWCLWTIQFLKLDWKDYWLDHDVWVNDNNEWEYDWVVDTWLYNSQFDTDENIAWNEDNRVDLFPDTINITDFKIYPYPNTFKTYAWKDYSDSANVSPYLRISFYISPSLKKRSTIKWTIPKVKMSTTINLINDYMFTKLNKINNNP